MALIFSLSSFPSLPDYGSFDLMVKKGAHFTVYAILYLLLFRAFHRAQGGQRPPGSRACLYPASVAVLYAISDEVHQSFVPLRNAAVQDVIIDAAGIAAMWLVLKRWPEPFRYLLK
jgi:VanZ family protein